MLEVVISKSDMEWLRYAARRNMNVLAELVVLLLERSRGIR